MNPDPSPLTCCCLVFAGVLLALIVLGVFIGLVCGL